MTDVELITLTLEGDREAFSALTDRYYERCLRYALRMLGNREDAEEVVQDTFLRVFRSLHRYEHRDRFLGWLYRILANRCRSRAVRESRLREKFVAAASQEETGASDYGEQKPEDHLRQRMIQEAFLQLRPQWREAFFLKHVEGMSYAEMEVITGVGGSALKMRVKRAREQLQRLISEDPHD